MGQQNANLDSFEKSLTSQAINYNGIIGHLSIIHSSGHVDLSPYTVIRGEVIYILSARSKAVK
jgi:hypothetical protein